MKKIALLVCMLLSVAGTLYSCPTCTSVPAQPGVVTVGGGSATVCNGDVRTYSTPLVACVTYVWTVPTGATIINGQGTDVITVSFGAGFIANGNLTVKASNACGLSIARTLSIVKRTTPAPATLTGTLTGPWCSSGVTNTYTAAAVSGATSYVWTAPAGTTIVSGQGTPSISLQINAGFTTGALTVKAVGPCGTGNAKSVTLKSTFTTPGVITGPVSNLCNTTGAYSIAAVPGAVGYNWTVPAGASVTAGQGTTNVTVTFTSFASGNIAVTASNACATSAAKTLALKGAPATPVTVTGALTGNWCASGATNSYTVTAVTGAIGYNWVAPAGTTILSGQGTATVSVQINAGFITGALTVAAVGSCGTSAAKSIILKTSFTAPGTITPGQSNYNLCNTTGTYSIAAVAGASSYNWSAPAGASITGGQGTTHVTVTFTSFVAGNLAVTATNACATSAAKTLSLWGYPQPPGYISGVAAVCPGSTYSFYIGAVTGATSYQWVLPSGWSINSGAGTASITVTAGATAGNIAVSSVNACGVSPLRTKGVTISSCKADDEELSSEMEQPIHAALSEVKFYPNPFSTVISVWFDAKNDGDETMVSVYDATGRLVKQVKEYAQKGVNIVDVDLDDEVPGVYMATLEVGGLTTRVRLIKQ